MGDRLPAHHLSSCDLPPSIMPIIARWHITAKFGHKTKILEGLKRWRVEIGAAAGFTDGRITTGRIGAKENLIEWETEHENISALEACWSNFGKDGIGEKHGAWSKEKYTMDPAKDPLFRGEFPV